MRQPEAGWKKRENGAELDKTTREQTRKMLKQSWGVTDRASADEALEELLDSPKTVAPYWDYSRVESNLGFYYLADYYTEKKHWIRHWKWQGDPGML